MRIYALIPDEYLSEAESGNVFFRANCTLGKDSSNTMVLVLTVVDEHQRAKNGTELIAEVEVLAKVENVSRDVVFSDENNRSAESAISSTITIDKS